VCFPVLPFRWKVHFPYNKIVSVTEAGNRIYAAGREGLFYYDKQDNSVERISKISGLSDVGISAVSYNEAAGVLVVAYTNANVDLVIGSKVINLSDIKRSNVSGKKTINNIRFIGNHAYLSCGFGIVVVDLVRREIKDTYLIGQGGTSLEVYDLAFDGIKLYAATFSGIIEADFNHPNLADFSAWNAHAGLPAGRYNTISFFNGKVYTNRSSTEFNKDDIYVYDGTGWSLFIPWEHFTTYKIEVWDQTLIVTNYFSVSGYDFNGNRVLHIDGNTYSNASPRQCIIGKDKRVWVADLGGGLVEVMSTGVNKIFPNGPATNLVYSMAASKDDLWVATGGRNTSTAPLFQLEGIYGYANNTWNTYKGNPANDTLNKVFDIIRIAVDPSDSKHIFAASWGRGIVELQNGNPVKFYNETNSSLQNVPVQNFYWLGVGGLAFDNNSNLWATNSGVASPLAVRLADGSWKSFSFPGVIAGGNNTLGNLVVDKQGKKWVILERGNGIMVFDDNGTIGNINDDRVRVLNDLPGKGKLPTTSVNALAVDNDGEVWVGTDKGIAVFYSPANIFSGVNSDAQQILIRQDGYNQFLLESEIVLSLAVDGANRKWIGTQNAGVFLMSADGTRELAHFSEQNSPLPSNEVSSIAINQKSGEVYFGTSRGIVSYRGTATEGGKVCKDVYAFPNPVRENYTGSIAIKGLIGNSNIKITDVSGNLVYESTSHGGQAIWDGKNFSGEKVKTGVYLVFASSKDGSETCVTKLLFIN
jgi:streptogramin lyase